MGKSIRDIVGIRDNISELAKAKVYVSEIDLCIADALFNLTARCVKRDYRDLDGIYDYYTDGFIYSKDVASLVKTFPNAVRLLGSLNRERNYGFVLPNGEVERTGMMGEADPIMEAQEMMVAYSGKKHDGPQLFASEDAYASFCDKRSRKAYEDRIRQYDNPTGELNQLFEYNYVTTGNGESLRVRKF